jgi:putative DNA primase/helicase
MAGVGKGKIGRALTLLGFGTRPIFVNWGKNEEEAEKRLVGILLQSPAQFTIDNANDAKVKGELLCTLITEGYAELRPLGSSVMAKTDCRPFTLLTGTHPTVTGDMARRALNIDVEARSAAPDRDAYPIEEVHTNRVALLQAAFTAMRAFRRAGMPAQGLAAIEAFDSARGGAVGSFDDWARKVRDLVYWLTGHDVSEGFQQNKKEDPDRRNDEALVAALHGVFGDSTFRSADAIAVHVKVSNNNPCGPEEQLLFNAIEEIFDKRSASSKSLGVWAHRQDKVHTKDFILKLGRDDISNTNTITVRKI